jgi:hypothetical protein
MKIAHALPALLLGLWTLVGRAEDIEPLDADFLEYLAALEGADGDWTEVSDEPPPAPDCKAADERKCAKDDEEDAAQAAAKKR